MKRRVAFAALLLALAGLAGCASTGTVTLDVPVPDAVGFHFQDARPVALRQSRVIASGGRIVDVYGDDRMAPPIPRLLPAVLQRDLGARLRGAQVVLTSFELVAVTAGGRFDPDAYRNSVGRSAVVAGTNPVATAPAPGFSTVSGPAKYAAQIVGTVNGRAFQARSDHESQFDSEAEAARAVAEVLARAVAEIGKGL